MKKEMNGNEKKQKWKKIHEEHDIPQYLIFLDSFMNNNTSAFFTVISNMLEWIGAQQH